MASFNNLQFINRDVLDNYGEHVSCLFKPGEYTLRIHRVKEAANRAGTGKLLIFIFEFGGKFTELLLNYPHSEPKTQWHGERKLVEINNSIGITKFDHHRELEGKTLVARITVDEGTNGYKDRNEFEFLAPAPLQQETEMRSQVEQPEFWASA